MRLSDSEMRVLRLVELEADLPATEVARRARLKTPTVQRILLRARETGLIAGRTAVVDLARLGLLECGIFLACRGDDASREKLTTNLLRRHEVSWLAELGGKWDLGFNVVARHPREIVRLLGWLTGASPQTIARYEICYRTERVRFHRSALFGGGASASGARSQVRFHSGLYPAHEEIDVTDRRILSALARSTHESFRELAGSIGIPVATFLRRIANLKQRGILLGFGYRFNLDLLSIQQYRFFISGSQHHDSLWEALLQFGRETGRIKMLARTAGSWCVEGECDVQSAPDLRGLLRDLRKVIVVYGASVETAPILSHRRFISFPAVA